MNIILTKSKTPVQIDAEIFERIRSGQGSSFLYIVSTQRTVKRLTKKFVDLSGGAFLSPQIYTLKMLSKKFYQLFGDDGDQISSAIQTIMMQNIVNPMKLEYFRPDPELSVPQGTIVRLVGTINRLKTAGVTIDLLRSDLGEAGESEAVKLNDIINIYEKYEQALRKNKQVDQADISRDVADLLSKSPASFRRIFPEVNLVVVSGYDVLSTHDFRIVESIAKIERLDTYIALDLDLSNRGLFGHLIENYDKLISSGFRDISSHRKKATSTEKERTDPSASLRTCFSRRLFSEDEPHKKIDQTDKIALCPTKTREDEVETIAKLIKNVMAKGLYSPAAKEEFASSDAVDAFDSPAAKEEFASSDAVDAFDASQNTQHATRISVTFYQLETYAPLIREIFPIYGIPFDIATGHELSNSPVIISILSLMEAVTENYSRRNVLRALKTPYFLFKHKEQEGSTRQQGEWIRLGGCIGEKRRNTQHESRSIDVGNLYAVSADLKITGGASDWQDKIDDRLKTQKFDLDDQEQSENKKLSLLRAREDIEYFVKVLEPIQTSLTPQKFRDSLISILQDLRLPRQILSHSHEKFASADIQAYKKFLELLDSVIDFIKSQHSDDKKHSLAFYLNTLRAAISQTTFYTHEISESGVQIVPITEMINPIIEPKESLFEIVILGGLVDGEFPAAFYPDIFLGEKRTKGEQERLLEDRFLFYQTVTNPKKHLYLTYPGFSDDGSELVRSPFVDEILRFADVKKITPDEFKTVYNEEELLKIYGEHFWHCHLLPDLSDKLRAVEHNIDVQKSRLEIKSPEIQPLPEYNGIIFDSLKRSSQDWIRGLKDRTYSISQLETYGKCPFRYFAQRILHLNQPDEIEEGLSFLEHGNLLHEIMYEFYSMFSSQFSFSDENKSKRKGQKPIKDCNEQEFKNAVKQILSIANTKIDQISLTGLFWDIQVEHIVGEPSKRKGILRSFMEEIERKSKTDTIPEYFEVPFGDLRGVRKNVLNLGRIKIGDVWMRGKIDRVEIGDGFFVVADYKTGSLTPKIDDIMEGRSLQLPVYLKALEQFWERQECNSFGWESRGLPKEKGDNMKGVAGVYYKLRDKCENKLGLGDREYVDRAFKASKNSNYQVVPGKKVNLSLDEVIEKSINYLSDYVEAISHGKFPLTSKPEKVCSKYCAYKRICRIGERAPLASGERGVCILRCSGCITRQRRKRSLHPQMQWMHYSPAAKEEFASSDAVDALPLASGESRALQNS